MSSYRTTSQGVTHSHEEFMRWFHSDQCYYRDPKKSRPRTVYVSTYTSPSYTSTSYTRSSGGGGKSFYEIWDRTDGTVTWESIG